MPLAVSLAALHKGSVRLTGEMSPRETGLETLDPCVRAPRPVEYDVRVEMMGDEIFVQGEIATVFECVCVRCLTPFEQPFRLAPWACLLPLQGEDAVKVENELVDLTPQLREDILLALPQHPLCRPDCGGLSAEGSGRSDAANPAVDTGGKTSAWSILDQLKLD